ncbi:MAG: hypothetical protein HGA28_05895 [Anaerolineaceae bacterium]|nr:hypothetical protein [Anaerolineaceae bacterium]
MTELRALIIDKPENKPFHTPLVPGNFKPMIKALEAGGITARCAVPQTSQELIGVIQDHSPDIVFSAAYGIEDEKGESCNVHRILEDMGVPYIGSTSSVLDIAIDKTRLKDIWIKEGIRTPPFAAFTLSEHSSAKHLDQLIKFPYILKPSRAGNSRGIDRSSVVTNADNLIKKLEEMLLVSRSIPLV